MGKKSWLLAVLALSTGIFAAEKNILNEASWRVFSNNGAGGKAEKQSDGSLKLTRSGENGVFWLYNAGNEYPLTAGKVYRIGVKNDGSMPMSIMVQVMGAGRTPYPAANSKNGVAEVVFIARPGESRARIHVGMKNPGTMSVKSIYVDEVDAKDNLLFNPAVSWKMVNLNGAKGTLTKNADNTYRMTRTGRAGAQFFYNGGSEYPVVEGKVYRIGVDYESSQDGSIMLQVIGAKRTPYPAAKGKNGRVEASFIARKGENKVRIHFHIPEGEVKIKRIYCQELDPADNLLLNPAIF